MTDIKRILEAIGALVEVLPCGPHTTVSLHGCDDAGLRLVISAGGSIEHYQNDAQTEEWQCASLRVGKVGLNAYGEHRPIRVADIDDSKAETALAQAEAVLS